MIKRNEYFIRSEEDGLQISVLEYCPEGDPRAVIQFSHGMCEHKERYEPFMCYLAERGFASVINDHRGHGASVKDSKDLGHFGNKYGGEALVNDLHQITQLIKERWPSKKIVLLGHSMGSLAVRAYLAYGDCDIAGLIVSGSPGENKAADFGLRLAAIESKVFGDHFRSPLFYAISVGVFDKTLKKRNIPGSWLSKSETNARRYAEDPLCGFKFTLNGYHALLSLMKAAYTLPQAKNPDLPIHFYSGEDDPCAPDIAGFRAAMQNLRDRGYKKVDGRMFPGLRHEILCEDEKEYVFETILNEAIIPSILR